MSNIVPWAARLATAPEFDHEAATVAVTEAAAQMKAIRSVITPGDLEAATTAVKNASTLKTQMETHRKQLKDPYKTAGENVDAWFKTLQKTLLEEDARLRRDIGVYDQRQREIAKARAEEEQRQLVEAAKAQREMDIAEGRPDQGVVVPEVVPQQTKLSEKNSSGVSSVRYKKWKVADITKVPPEYLAVNEKAVSEVRKQYDYDDASPIPGIEFTVETGIKV
jgi:hypothetical protein